MSSYIFSAFLSDLVSAALFESWAALLIGFLLLAGASALGLLALPPSLGSAFVRALGGAPLFSIAGTSLAVLIYLLRGTTRAGLIVVTLLAVILVAVAFWRGLWKELWSAREIGLFTVMLLLGFVLAFFGWGETRDGTVRAITGAWGDGPLHVLIAEAFSNRVGPNLAMPAFVGEQLREPLGFDFLAALLRSAGFTVGGAFTLPAAALLACLIAWAGQRVVQLLRESISTRTRALAAFLAGALVVGFGGLQWLVMATRTSSWSLERFFGAHDVVWEKAEDLGLVWENHLVMFASQKHLLLAAAFLSVLAAVLLAYVRKQPPEARVFEAESWTLYAYALFTGLLPLFHMHAFLAAGLLWVGAWLATRSRHVFAAGVLAAVIATPSVLWFSGLFGRAGFISIAAGWMAAGGAVGWTKFWWVNLGVFLPVAILACRRAYRIDRPAALLLGIPALGLFVLGNLFQFQPYRWDNFKLFLFAWVLLLPLVVAEMARWRFPAARFLTLVLAGLMVLTPLASFATHARSRMRYPVYTSAHRAQARLLDQRLPADAVVLANSDTEHNHPLTLTGRTLVSGYAGWMWTRRFPWEQRAEMLQEMRSDNPQTFCRLASVLGVTHVVDADGTAQSVSEKCVQVLD